MSEAYLVDLYGGVVPVYCLDCLIPSMMGIHVMRSWTVLT